MSTSPSRIFVARLSGLPVFDPAGDQVGKVRDIVVVLRPGGLPPRILGLVVEVFGRRSIFVPMTRVTSIDSGQVITTGLVNMRRFQQRPTETLVFGQMLDRRVRIRESGVEGTVYDLAMDEARVRESDELDSQDSDHIQRLINEAGYTPSQWEQQRLDELTATTS